MRTAVAKANANVALAKYWGKRDEILNLPYTGSISITLAGLETRVELRPAADRVDEVLYDGTPAAFRHAQRVSAFLDLIGRVTGKRAAARVDISSNFPIAAGLASSASTFAALAVAAADAYGWSTNATELSILARRGSGSATRSLFAGFVEWLPGELPDGSDSYAVQVAAPQHWPLGVVIAITDTQPKPIGSREGMSQAVRHSPFFRAWVQSHEVDIEGVRHGILTRDLAALGTIAEHNCLKMHAVALAAQPALVYWLPATLAVIHRVRELRHAGLDAYFSIDAGPQVKVLCPLSQRATVAAAVGAVEGVQRVLLSEPGPAPTLMRES